jgi:hypothetical protein
MGTLSIYPTGKFEGYMDAGRSQPIPMIRRGEMLSMARMIFDGVAYSHANNQQRMI